MEFKILHIYPDLMSLYGSYANVSVLRRALETAGDRVTVETLVPGDNAALADADFLFMGAGTERAQKAALAELVRFGAELRAAAADSLPMLFAGNAMELLGSSITDSGGTVYDGLALAGFSSRQGTVRYAEDVYGHTALYPEPLVGFINKCSIISGVETPLLTEMEMGFGNEARNAPEGYHAQNVFASQLTGPILVKNFRLLDVVRQAVYSRRGAAAPSIPADRWAEAGYAVTEEALRHRSQQSF